MIQGNRRLQAMRTGRNPSVRNARRNNGHVRAEAPSPNPVPTVAGPPKAASPESGGDLEISPNTESLMQRLDVMRQQPPSPGGLSSSPPTARPSSSSASNKNEILAGAVGEFATVMSRLQRLMAIQKRQLRRGAGLE